MMFGRKKKKDAVRDEAQEPLETTSTTDAAGDATGDRSESAEADQAPEGELADADGTDETSSGPRDRSEVTDIDALIDLGSLHAAPGPGMELRLEIDSSTNEVSAVQIGDDHGSVQIQVFAAPRSSGIWEEIRGEISEMIQGNGGTVEEATGPFGPELRTRLAQTGPQGRTVFAPAIFAGVDGRRWFLRAVYSGAPAVDEAARGPYDDCLRSVVVTRGDDPRAPREMLPMTVPTEKPEGGPVELDEDGARPDDLKPFERGPEITEVR